MSFAAHLPFPSPASALSQPPQVSSSSPPSTTPNRAGCCENGRPVLTDPTTGQSVCSCQYSSALLGYSRLPGLSGSLFSPSSYSAGAPPPSGYGVALGSEGSAFYSPLTAGGSNLRDTSDAWRSLTQTSLYDTSPMGFYPYGGYGGLDLNARRKNATRESTNTLKAWLHEHIKNPYPTKGEKIMLAIITKMTLTQVSTWFANARRRLKKENKMTWSPRNRSEDGDEDDDDDDAGDEKGGDDNDKERRLSNDGEEIDVDGSGGSNNNNNNKYPRTKPHHNSIHSHNHTTAAESDSISPVPSIGEDARSRLSPPQSRDSDPGSFHLNGHTPNDADHPHHHHSLHHNLHHHQKPKIWSVTDFLHPGGGGGGGGGGSSGAAGANNNNNSHNNSSNSKSGGSSSSSSSEPSSCKETGMKMDIMRCVPTSAEAAVDLTGRTMPGGNAAVSAAAAHAHAQAAHAAAMSAAAAARGGVGMGNGVMGGVVSGGGGFLSAAAPGMTSLSPAAQQLSSYQNALASYAAHASPYSPYALAASAEMNKLVMKPTATRFSPYSHGVNPKQASLESPFPPAREFSVLREGE